MGQKINPTGLRIGINKPWKSQWYEEKRYSQWLHEDIKIRNYLQKTLKDTGVAKVEIKRMAQKITIGIDSVKPGQVIGRHGANAELLKNELRKMTQSEIFLNIQPVQKADLDAKLVAENIANQLERRQSFRRAMKKCVQATMKAGAIGIRINCAGRLGGAEMSRTEWYREGRVPLHTLRADIDYGIAEALTTYGIIGVKVWIFKGDIL